MSAERPAKDKEGREDVGIGIRNADGFVSEASLGSPGSSLQSFQIIHPSKTDLDKTARAAARGETIEVIGEDISG